MAKKLNGIMLAMLLLPVAATASHWGYEGNESPEHWGELDSNWTECQKGQNQAPVDIRETYNVHLKPLRTQYTTSPDTLLNNGHTIQASYNDSNTANTLFLDNDSFTLKQFHFHAPSENMIHGKHYPMELHLVHQNSDGEIAVVAVMFVPGTASTELAKLWKVMPDHADKSSSLLARIDVNKLLPGDKTYWRFSGSLTTPPCSEGVRWIVMKHPLQASAEQLAQFKSVIHHSNNRPVQKLHGRTILE
ncbi:carbonic anhydrase family protein [Jejubacter calystegiae]|uniref:Carbonic anhydrase n=1 Tax=Jejubacter calystegiae TaxID=2579935 RepID=A0A4P8YDX2_9ENTR|nr:carbonic anhydrase family protein [Jejubacter calystegiae]QCT18709.1 carbonic anhydrase family protein [Jejubacter calystegiae]